MTGARNVEYNCCTERSDRAIARLAARQHGVFTRSQLRRAGLSDREITYRLKVGRFRPLHRGVYTLAGAEVTRNSSFLAAVLATGRGAVLSHAAAATLHGFWDSRLPPIDVTTTRKCRARRGIRLHLVATLPATEVVRREGIPVTTPARALVDLAGTFTTRALTRAFHEAQVQRTITEEELEKAVEERRGRRGTNRLASLLDQGPRPTRSSLEDAFLLFLEQHDLPRPQTNILLEGREVDAYFPDHDLVVELDGGRYHTTRQRREQDRQKQAALEAHGHRVLRITDDQLAGAPGETAERLRVATA